MASVASKSMNINEDGRNAAVGGFTLLEVLIALAVLAVSAMAVLSQTNNSLYQLQQLREKTLAQWTAEYQLNQLRVAESWPATGSAEDAVEFAGREWRVRRTVSETTEPWLRKIEVSVAPKAGDTQASPLVTLTGYRGRF